FGPSKQALDLALSPDGRTVAIRVHGGALSVRDAVTGRERWRGEEGRGGPSLLFSTHGGLLLSRLSDLAPLWGGAGGPRRAAGAVRGGAPRRELVPRCRPLAGRPATGDRPGARRPPVGRPHRQAAGHVPRPRHAPRRPGLLPRRGVGGDLLPLTAGVGRGPA